MSIDGLSRRNALSAAAAVGVGAPLLAACGSEGDGAATEAPKAKSGTRLASTRDVEVGACAVFPDERVVLTQPTEGTFKCFSAVCTHQGCLVSPSAEGDIPCTCHGSAFSLEDGSVLEGPATAPLPEVEITVDGDDISIA